MKPHILTMKAFGPFAKETTVDFDAMGNSIYLISGDTGSGKTTIFDGIIYALYGTASGAQRSALGTEAFHSDYAKEGAHRDEMRVSLTFSNGGRRFTVSRRMYWGKRGSAQKAVRESSLSENGNTIADGRGREDQDDVTAKVKEILGLDADQFRRIIMLAQGEFQRFLSAKSDERGVILGKLYDNRRHQDLQLRLKAAETLLKEQDEDQVRKAQMLLGQFIFPKEVPTVSIDHPGLLCVLSGIIDQMNEESGLLRTKIRLQEDERMAMSAQKTKGETGNRLLDDLDKARKQLSALLEQKERMEELRNLLRRCQEAEKVLSFESAMERARVDRDRILERIRALEREKGELEKSVEILRERSATVRQENAPLIADAAIRRSAVENVLHFYDDLARGQEVLSARQKEEKKAAANLSKAQERLTRGQEAQKTIARKLESLSQAGDLAVLAAKRSLDDLMQRRDQLREARSELDCVRRESEKVTALAGELSKARQAELDAESNHLRLNAAFLQGQAGILAQDLRDRLLSQSVVLCPVCGASHTVEDAASFAVYTEDIPTREQVDAAFAAWNAAAEASRRTGEEYSAAQTALARRKEALERSFSRLIPDDGQEALSAKEDTAPEASRLSHAIALCEKQVSEAKKNWQHALSERQEKEKALSGKEKADQEVISAQEEYHKAEREHNEAQLAAAQALTSALNWKKQLEGYPENRDCAQEEISALSERMEALTKQMQEADSEVEDCRRKQSENAGSIAAALLEKEERRKAAEQAKERFEEARKERSFSDDRSYHEALSPEGDRLDAKALADWIRIRSAQLEEYDQKIRGCEAAIGQLSESTKGMERTDIPAITERIGVLEGKLEQLRSEEKELESNLRTDRRICEQLKEVQEKRDSHRKIFEKLGPLSQTANGNYAFSRYVLSGFFHRIVEQANVHLDTMTDGEYQLVPTQEGDRRASLGLGLRILNTITNLERETASLSGGQMFEASLSLALGLSDVVQMESTGTIRIDSMFIDEGFGSLDGVRLDRAIEVLAHLSGGKRQIGIISHVARLDECLPRKIRVIATHSGSCVQVETDMLL